MDVVKDTLEEAAFDSRQFGCSPMEGEPLLKTENLSTGVVAWGADVMAFLHLLPNQNRLNV